MQFMRSDVEAGDLRDGILRLEDDIEALGKKIERCRKIDLAAKAVIAIGVLLLAAVLLRVIRFDALALIAGVSAGIGGIVLWGSNSTTAKQFSERMRAAEVQRAELIGRIDLRPVGAMDVSANPATLH